MKKKNIIYMLATAVCTLLCASCENDVSENGIKDQLYMLTSGEKVVSVYRAKTSEEINFSVYKSGMRISSADVELTVDQAALAEYNTTNGTALQVLPADCYTINKTSIQLEALEVKDSVKIVLDVKKIDALQGVGTRKYAIPLKLQSKNQVAVVDDKSTLIIIPEITGGMRPGSGKVLWTKSFEQLGILPAASMTHSIAVTDRYLYINTRNLDLNYYDRFTGDSIGAITLPFKGSLTNFTITNDDKGNMLITNLRNAKNVMANQTIYRVRETGQSEVFITCDHTYVTGRKLSVKGDLDGDALIMASVDNSSTYLYWEVKGGVLQSNDPKLYSPDPLKASWQYQTDIHPLTANLSDGVFLTSYSTTTARGFGFFDGTGAAQYMYDLVAGGFDPAAGIAMNGMDVCRFNENEYLVIAGAKGTVDGIVYARLLNVNKPEYLAGDPTASSLVAYDMPTFTCTKNVNLLADAQLIAGAETMEMYVLGVNGSVTCVQFDCKAE